MPGNKTIVVTGTGRPIPWEIEDRDIPSAGPGSLVVKVLFVPLVDYHKILIDGSGPLPYPVPFTPGGGSVGRVHAIGPDTTAFKPGDLVCVDPTIAARDDPSAQILIGTLGGKTEGSAKLASGLWRTGVFAQYAQLPLENVYKLDEGKLVGEFGYDISDLGIIQTCMVPYGGLEDAGVKPGDTVVLSPATGRFSGSAVITALAMGANVVATGRSQAKLDELVKAVGSPKTMKTAIMTGEVERDTAALAKAVGPRGADVVLELSPAAAGANGRTPSHLLAGLNVLRRGGTLSLMGGLPGTIALPYLGIMLKNVVVRGRYMYDRDQIVQVIKLAESGKLLLGKEAGLEVIGKYGLEQFEKALDEAEATSGWGKIVGIAP